ncbi:DUF4232 domain-containing protein [Streptomyces sp. SID3212]|uniref:DUF4232 domain-containing protein n=1 Tax=Streptomyces sp. SID3212 TaxID=2690259 RepID=UPI0031F67DB0
MEQAEAVRANRWTTYFHTLEKLMRSHLATRPARLALAAVAAVALTATAITGSASAATAGSDRDSSNVRNCGTNDLSFTISSRTQAGGYLLVTAKAKSGVTCHLEGILPTAFFGSSRDSHVSPAQHAVSEGVTLSGSTAAYAGINPKTTNDENGIQFGQLFLSVAGDEDNTVTLTLPRTVTVDRPIATNWQADPADAVPFG